MGSRNTICFPRRGTQDVTKNGDHDFQKELDRWYSVAECQALERLLDLKTKLRATASDDFWAAAVEGLAKVVGSEIAFVMKRMLVDDQNTAVEMPPLGEPGSCLMAAALHYCTSNGEKHTVKQSKFHAYACPCAYMRHDKIFLIPENLDAFITNNPNQMPFKVDAYMAVPLFAEGKCIAHFGVMWTEAANPTGNQLSWAFVETLLHSLEDMFGQRLVEGSNFRQPTEVIREQQASSRVIPHEAISVAQSLRPYAGSLSHELRTPMQGVVGMLDVMYATVEEAVQSQDDPYLRKVFQNLKESIEVVQDSSRRAVVAADNVVHAYDMNMSIPESISPLQDEPDRRLDIVIAGQEIPMAHHAQKRRRVPEDETMDASPSKQAKLESVAAAWSERPEASQEIKAGLLEAEHVNAQDGDLRQTARTAHAHHSPDVRDIGHEHTPMPVSGSLHRAANVRAVLQYVINEGLKTGGRPDMVTATSTMQGEYIEVRSRGSDGTIKQKTIEWSVAQDIPKTIRHEEKDFSKLVSCVVLNAIKFTDSVVGRIDVHAQMSPQGRHISIKVADNGPGIPSDFLPKLFKPFSQGNGSLTRQSDGLGLGLMVAKGIARKLGGDLTCTRAVTGSSEHGCEFEIRLPITPGDVVSRATSPCSSPAVLKDNAGAQVSTPPSELPDPSAHDMITPLRRQNSEIARKDIVSGLDHINNMPNGASTGVHHKRPPLAKLHRSNARVRTVNAFEIDRQLANKYPLQFLVAEDNKINRRLLVSMLSKLGYKSILEAHDGLEAVRQMELQHRNNVRVDVVLMDLWMPGMDGYEATQRILDMQWTTTLPTVLAVTADVTDGALERAAQAGMKGFMSKPYKLQDLQRLIIEYCSGEIEDAQVADDAHATVMQQAAIVA